jgi:hypothetical protein
MSDAVVSQGRPNVGLRCAEHGGEQNSLASIMQLRGASWEAWHNAKRDSSA